MPTGRALSAVEGFGGRLLRTSSTTAVTGVVPCGHRHGPVDVVDQGPGSGREAGSRSKRRGCRRVCMRSALGQCTGGHELALGYGHCLSTPGVRVGVPRPRCRLRGCVGVPRGRPQPSHVRVRSSARFRGDGRAAPDASNLSDSGGAPLVSARWCDLAERPLGTGPARALRAPRPCRVPSATTADRTGRTPASVAAPAVATFSTRHRRPLPRAGLRRRLGRGGM